MNTFYKDQEQNLIDGQVDNDFTNEGDMLIEDLRKARNEINEKLNQLM